MTGKQLFERAQRVIPGGVNSPVRAYRAVGGEPFFAARAEGPYIFDEDGNRYIDLILAYGPLILGHRDSDVVDALSKTLAHGFSFGVPTIAEVELAEKICKAMPSMRARVVCALGLVMATFWPTSWLTSVLLPALGAPITATTPHF